MPSISKIDEFVINKVKELREKNKFSQKELSLMMDFSEGFVGHVENPKRRDKYNLTHLNILAEIFKCSPRDFLPEKSI
jgi:transcriptional regulator with XRE-family HTH domain